MTLIMWRLAERSGVWVLLPMDTVFASKKTRTRVTGQFLPMPGTFAALSGVSLEGYEIHMGESVRKEGILPATKLMSWPEISRKKQRQKVLFMKMYVEPMYMGCLIKRKLWRL